MAKQIALEEQLPAFVLNRLAIVLKEEGKNNKYLANELGYAENTISKWTRNAVQPPLHTFYRIALLLNRDLPELFVSIKNISKEQKASDLKTLAEIAERSKRNRHSEE